MISPSQRPLPDNTQQTNIHAPGGIRTRNPSRRAAADSRLRPLGHWDRHSRTECNSQIPETCLIFQRFHYLSLLIILLCILYNCQEHTLVSRHLLLDQVPDYCPTNSLCFSLQHLPCSKVPSSAQTRSSCVPFNLNSHSLSWTYGKSKRKGDNSFHCSRHFEQQMYQTNIYLYGLHHKFHVNTFH